MSKTVAQVLRHFGAEIDEDAVATAVEGALRALFEPLYGGSDLPDDQRAILATGSLRFDDASTLDRAAADTAASYAALVASAVTIVDLAARVGVDPSRIRHRLTADELYSVPAGHGRTRLIPRFQLDDSGRPLPGLAIVLKALPDGLHPLEIEAFFATAAPELRLAGRVVTPRAYLAAGGDARCVARLAAELF